MTTEQLPDGLQRAVNAIEWHSACCDEYKVEIDAIRAEHQQRLMLQHHAADQARRIADLETKCGTIKRLHDKLVDEKQLLVEAQMDEIAENLRLRDLGRALPDENITAMTERVIRERDDLRTKHDELLVALHGIGKALGIPEGERSPYSVTCGALERVNRLAEIEAFRAEHPAPGQLTDAMADAHADAVLRAAGSSLRNYTMQSSRDAIRMSVRAIETAVFAANNLGDGMLCAAAVGERMRKGGA